ncbi:MAG: NUDIX domain-containing protein [Phycisphaeraceae bacterium]|nr:MAG: NUDIX domain-containing protein [Phycisphaeraceae bacterium]
MTAKHTTQGDPEEGHPYKIAVLCDLRDADGRLLLLHRKKEPNRDLYSPIGGKLDTWRGESPTQCAQREILEEAGIEIPIERLRLLGMISENGYASSEGRTNWLLFYFRVDGPVELEPFEMREGRLEWVEPERIPTLPLPETDRKIIWPLVEEYEGGFFAVHIDCEGEEMTWNIEQAIRPHTPSGSD